MTDRFVVVNGGSKGTWCIWDNTTCGVWTLRDGRDTFAERIIANDIARRMNEAHHEYEETLKAIDDRAGLNFHELHGGVRDPENQMRKRDEQYVTVTRGDVVVAKLIIRRTYDTRPDWEVMHLMSGEPDSPTPLKAADGTTTFDYQTARAVVCEWFSRKFINR
jgi:hypothetical protein